MDRVYMCIDLKSFYASVECIKRNLNPLTTNLVVADPSRTEKTICLAVSPSLKQYGISGRARLYAVVQKVKKINYDRKKLAYHNKFNSKSSNDTELKNNKNLELDFIIAKPRMAEYIKMSAKIYNVYLKYISKEDIHVYSIDEVFCDITSYLKYTKKTPEDFVSKIIEDVYKTTGITATAGIGTNLYLAKVAMDILAKHRKPNKYGVRIAYLDEMSYRKELWNHKPLTDFWRVGKGYMEKLIKNNMYTMGDIALTSIENEDKLYKLFGVNAELLIDHAWGYESCTMKNIKDYKPKANSISSGQVLHYPYDYKKTRLIVKEMCDSLSLSLVEKNLVTNQLILNIGYDINNIDDKFNRETVVDYYGRTIPKPSHGTTNFEHKTSSNINITKNVIELYDKIIDKSLLIKRLSLTAITYINNQDSKIYKQFDLFSDYEEQEYNQKKQLTQETKDNNIQNTILNIKNKYGKNSIIKGMDMVDYATTRDRNEQIGGHHE